MRFTLLWFSLLFTVNILFSNASLLAVSVNLHQVSSSIHRALRARTSSLSMLKVVKSTTPLFTMGISFFLLGERYPKSLLLPVILVVFGVVLTVLGEFDLNLFGLIMATIGCFFGALKGIVTQRVRNQYSERSPRNDNE